MFSWNWARLFAVGYKVRTFLRRADELSNDADMLEMDGRELYWWPKENFLDSELDLKVVEGLLGPMTIRTKGTVERLAAKFL